MVCRLRVRPMPASRNDDITSYEYPQDDNGDDIVGNIVQMYRSGL